MQAVEGIFTLEFTFVFLSFICFECGPIFIALKNK